jgi:DNA mismatch endonuclease (patch repair protein)
MRRKADFVFRRAKVAVFVDGCYWHGCPTHCTWPRHNAEWWRQKIGRNRRRDANTTARLRAKGWKVIRVWEHQNAVVAVRRIGEMVRLQTSLRSRGREARG